MWSFNAEMHHESVIECDREFGFLMNYVRNSSWLPSSYSCQTDSEIETVSFMLFHVSPFSVWAFAVVSIYHNNPNESNQNDFIYKSINFTVYGMFFDTALQ